MFKNIFFAGLLCVGILKLDAQDSMNLQQCIQYALEHNTQLLRTQLDVEQRENDFTRSKASVLPTVNGFASHNYNFGRTIDPFTNQFAQPHLLYINSGSAINFVSRFEPGFVIGCFFR